MNGDLVSTIVFSTDIWSDDGARMLGLSDSEDTQSSSSVPSSQTARDDSSTSSSEESQGHQFAAERQIHVQFRQRNGDDEIAVISATPGTSVGEVMDRAIRSLADDKKAQVGSPYQIRHSGVWVPDTHRLTPDELANKDPFFHFPAQIRQFCFVNETWPSGSSAIDIAIPDQFHTLDDLYALLRSHVGFQWDEIFIPLRTKVLEQPCELFNDDIPLFIVGGRPSNGPPAPSSILAAPRSPSPAADASQFQPKFTHVNKTPGGQVKTATWEQTFPKATIFADARWDFSEQRWWRGYKQLCVSRSATALK
jgi:hypothetical protein